MEVEISMNTARALIRDPAYEESFGLLPGKHYRKERGLGCYHLRVRRDRAWLHRDGRDPRRDPLGHFIETPGLWVPSALAVTAAALAVAHSRSKSTNRRRRRS